MPREYIFSAKVIVHDNGLAVGEHAMEVATDWGLEAPPETVEQALGLAMTLEVEQLEDRAYTAPLDIGLEIVRTNLERLK